MARGRLLQQPVGRHSRASRARNSLRLRWIRVQLSTRHQNCRELHGQAGVLEMRRTRAAVGTDCDVSGSKPRRAYCSNTCIRVPADPIVDKRPVSAGWGCTPLIDAIAAKANCRPSDGLSVNGCHGSSHGEGWVAGDGEGNAHGAKPHGAKIGCTCSRGASVEKSTGHDEDRNVPRETRLTVASARRPPNVRRLSCESRA